MVFISFSLKIRSLTKEEIMKNNFTYASDNHNKNQAVRVRYRYKFYPKTL